MGRKYFCGRMLQSSRYFQSNKTPGNDGIPIEFYRSFVKGEMSCFQKQAIITHIEKKGKDRSSLENYKLQNNFNLSLQQLTQFLQRPHTVALEPYVRAFQFIVLSGILYTNSKFYQVGYISSDLCSFCIRASESLYHLFYFCPFSKTFWSDFESFWHLLTNEKIQLSLQDIINNRSSGYKMPFSSST